MTIFRKEELKLEKKYLIDLENAEEFLNVARNVLDSSIKTSANRLYFALEKAVTAYLGFKGKDIPKNHQKLWELANELLGKEYYQALRKLYDLRMQADYGLMSMISPLNNEIMKNTIEKTKHLIDKISKEILQKEEKK